MQSIPIQNPRTKTNILSSMAPGRTFGRILGGAILATGVIAITNAVTGHKTNNSEKVDKLEKELEMLKFQNQLLVKH